jgi:hypothetical protein
MDVRWLLRSAAFAWGSVLVVARGGVAFAEPIADPTSLPTAGSGLAQWFVVVMLGGAGFAVLVAADRMHHGVGRRRRRGSHR